ncbi:MAG: site-specific DNA-methyltransferase [Armatimonadetes bacterium]|nr:site-specific DNA-methyltransferase [Armatimonadota bacterium]
MTSPPYWSLRSYHIDSQIGLELSLDDFIARLVTVFEEVRRVLREDGTLWLNIGDSYACRKTGAPFMQPSLVIHELDRQSKIRQDSRDEEIKKRTVVPGPGDRAGNLLPRQSRL